MSKHSLADITAAARDPHLLDRMIAAAAEQGHPYPASQIADAAARIVATPITEAGDSIASVYAYAVQTHQPTPAPGANPAAVLDQHVRDAVAAVLGEPAAPGA